MRSLNSVQPGGGIPLLDGSTTGIVLGAVHEMRFGEHFLDEWGDKKARRYIYVNVRSISVERLGKLQNVKSNA